MVIVIYFADVCTFEKYKQNQKHATEAISTMLEFNRKAVTRNSKNKSQCPRIFGESPLSHMTRRPL